MSSLLFRGLLRSKTACAQLAVAEVMYPLPWAEPWVPADWLVHGDDPRGLLPGEDHTLASDYTPPLTHLKMEWHARSQCGSGARKRELREQLWEAALFVRARVRQLQHAVREVQWLTEALQCMQIKSAPGSVPRTYVQAMTGEVPHALKQRCMSQVLLAGQEAYVQ